ncbi:hypothetical protein U1Q18_023072 [Sarracenia purpurea var. burkii]
MSSEDSQLPQWVMFAVTITIGIIWVSAYYYCPKKNRAESPLAQSALPQPENELGVQPPLLAGSSLPLPPLPQPENELGATITSA